MSNERPRGREKNITGQGKSVYRRGEGTGTGPVGNTGGYSGRTGGSSGGHGPGPRSIGGLGIVALIVIFLLRGGLGGLLGGGASSAPSQTQSPYQTAAPAQTQTGTSGSGLSQGSSGSFSGGQSQSSSSQQASQYGSFDLSQLASLFGSQNVQSLSGSSSGWSMAGSGSGSASSGSLNTSVAPGSRSKFTKIKGNGQDTVTIMVYMCGTDLESKSGMATSDLSEMTKAQISDQVNLIVYTGGASAWKNNVVSNQNNQVYKVTSGGLTRLASESDKTMTDPNTLAGFIQWTAVNFPADRYELIFWDHGSGSLSGYGYDEKHPRAGSMSLAGINNALTSGGIKFDFIGFDACLMATAENALMLSQHADYMIASEETEPGYGWYYTNWLTELSRNTSRPTLEVGKRIIDDFVDVSAQKARGQSTTLSIVDLAELQNTLPEKLTAFSGSTSDMLGGSDYKTVAKARQGSREFATSSRIDQVDLTHFALNLGTSEGKALAQTVTEAVKYNRTSPNMTNSYGLSIYFPSSRPGSVNSMIKTYQQIGMDDSYSKVIQQYAQVSSAGQSYYGSSYGGGSGSPFPMLSGSGSYSSGGGSDMTTELLTQLLGSFLSAGADAGFSARSLPAETIVESLEDSHFAADSLVWTTRDDGKHILTLTQDDWDKVSGLDLNVFYDDGTGYIDLGMDNSFAFTEDGALIGETDRTWTAINGQPVAYYHTDTLDDGETWTIHGYVPALLNGERVKLLLVFDEETPYGYVAGAEYEYKNGETETVAKAMVPETVGEDGEPVERESFLKPGDVLDFLCDYYSYEGEYQDSYMLGDQMVIGDDVEISYVYLDDAPIKVTYRFTDLFGGEFWTPALDQ